MINAKRALLYILGVVLTVGLVWFGLSYYLSLRTLTVNYDNVKSVSIFSAKTIYDTKNEKPAKIISSSGQNVKLKKGSYILQYAAEDNYQSGFATLNLQSNHQAVNLSPGYSDTYLNKMLDEQLGSIKASIIEKYPLVDQLYTIQRGRLYRQGEWYGTTLTYKADATGGNLFKTDTLRVVLKKENGQWVVKTNPPTILLSKYDYPDIPEDVLRNVNSLPAKPTG